MIVLVVELCMEDGTILVMIQVPRILIPVYWALWLTSSGSRSLKSGPLVWGLEGRGMFQAVDTLIGGAKNHIWLQGTMVPRDYGSKGQHKGKTRHHAL